MNETDIIEAFKRAGATTNIRDHVKHPAWKSFVRAMKTKQYGPAPTLDAWLWFASGWDATY